MGLLTPWRHRLVVAIALPLVSIVLLVWMSQVDIVVVVVGETVGDVDTSFA